MKTPLELLNATIQFLRDRKKAYQLCFPHENAATKIVLADLAKFCRANESCVVPGDPDVTRVLEGRREVWLRIQQHLNLSPEDLFAIYNQQRKTPNG